MKFSFWNRKRRNQELNEEIQAHLTLSTREEIEVRAFAQRSATLTARREFGNETLARETTRDMWAGSLACRPNAGRSLRPASSRKKSRLHGGGDSHARTRHRRKHRDF